MLRRVGFDIVGAGGGNAALAIVPHLGEALFLQIPDGELEIFARECHQPFQIEQRQARMIRIAAAPVVEQTQHAQPAILLVTDNYDKAWRARGLPGSSRSQYEVMPADYTLMCVPLGAGHHLIRLEYAPSGYLIGRWISLAALLIYLSAVCVFLTRRQAPGA